MKRYTVAYGADYKRRATFYTIYHAEQFLRALWRIAAMDVTNAQAAILARDEARDAIARATEVQS